MTCIIWRGPKTAKGYGRLRTKHGEVRAHRAAYQAVYLDGNPIPHGLIVMHTCDMPSCMNPEHLVLSTHKDNVADCIKKGRRRYPTRETHPLAKLKSADKAAILEARANGETIRSLASRYGVALSTMHGFCAESVPEAEKVVGVVGFEPTTSTSRTLKSYHKCLKLLEGSREKTMNEAKTEGGICAVSVPVERARCALWVYENNPPHPIIDAILTDAYEALRRAKGE